MPRAHPSLARTVSLRRWTHQHAREILDALDASGLSVAHFAARHSLQAQRIHLWRRKLADDRTARPRPAFVEVAARATAPSARSVRYELITAHGESLRIDGPFDAQSARALFALLREGRPC